MFVLKWEGGYTNDPDDPGGETKYGITKRDYPHLDIKKLTIEQAKQIYWKDYWLKGKCDKIEQFSPRLAFIHFNYCVNTGVRQAGRLLQRAIRRNGFNIKVDGIIGERTLDALEACDMDLTYDAYSNYGFIFYITLVERRRRLKKFLFGWLRRSKDAYLFGLDEFDR